MSIYQAIILGIIQGITEFLPISSSAHLVITPFLLGWKLPAQEAFIFDVLVQMGTLLAVIAYFWTDIWQITVGFSKAILMRQPFKDQQARLGWFILLATLPAGVVGLLIKDQVEAAFSSPWFTSLFLFGTAALLVTAEMLGSRSRSLDRFSWQDALWMGLFQAAAIFPGISRSGATISGGMMRQLDRPAAARFSFLMSLPIMLAAGLLAFNDLLQVENLSSQVLPLAIGFLTSAIIGYFSIRWLLGYLTRHSLYSFAIYCTGLGFLTILVYLILI